MSLIRLLTTTRSLSDVKNEPSPYRMTEQGLLPKFGPKSARKADTPVRLGGQECPPYEASVGDAKENLGEGHGDRKDAGCSLKLESSRKPKGLAVWWQKLFRRQPRREPVQTEFSLDLVKVVRNDLTDAEAGAGKPEKNKLKLELQPGEKARVEAESVFGVSRG